jgi:membrane-associated protease RseP (regulator of RpoE activity)
MINLDMVGRLQKGGGLQAGGIGTSPRLKDIILENNDSSVLSLSFTEEGYGPSDHSSFYGKNIPVIFFTTGAHLDYHTPSDVYDSINFNGMVQVTNLIYNVAEELATMKGKLEFREAGPNTDQSRAMRRQGVTLGFMPDFAGNVKNGLRADFITPGKPAARGGMKKGDIITAIEGKPVNNIQDYMFRMGQLKHGQTITVEITRNEQKIVLLIQL